MQGLARYVFQSGKSPKSWLVWQSFAMSLVGFGNSQVWFNVCIVMFPESIIPYLYHEGDLLCLVFLGGKLPGPWKKRMCQYDLWQQVRVHATVLTPWALIAVCQPCFRFPVSQRPAEHGTLSLSAPFPIISTVLASCCQCPNHLFLEPQAHMLILTKAWVNSRRWSREREKEVPGVCSLTAKGSWNQVGPWQSEILFDPNDSDALQGMVLCFCCPSGDC